MQSHGRKSWALEVSKKVLNGLGRQLEELENENWFARVLAEWLKHTVAVDWERQFQGDSISEPATMHHDESRGNGALQSAVGGVSTITIWPCWQRGQLVKDRPVSS